MRVMPAVTLFLLMAATAARSQVRNAELGYSLTRPEGFTDFPAARSQKDVVDAWSETAPASANGALVLLVARMHGTLPREAMRQEDVPANTQVVSFKWKGFDVSGRVARGRDQLAHVDRAGGPLGHGRRVVDRHRRRRDRHPRVAQAARPGRVTRAARP